eukprot:TRINITY_DN9654_c0_g1_i2.p1 TRINITY_DN9654_c0_g1~~TRINITY_DN9654_c0_g1_i2.p1  ORF type:complete len:218 (-),score=29.97 TRINITY_DN9654_c0_g1_i2:172-825(-)
MVLPPHMATSLVHLTANVLPLADGCVSRLARTSFESGCTRPLKPEATSRAFRALAAVFAACMTSLPARSCARRYRASKSSLTANAVAPVSSSTASSADQAPGVPQVTLFTKPGCTLCDKALNELQSSAQPFELRTVNIDAPGNEDWRARYWCDIPVFHIDGAFWVKHQLTRQEAEALFRYSTLPGLLPPVLMVSGCSDEGCTVRSCLGLFPCQGWRA